MQKNIILLILVIGLVTGCQKSVSKEEIPEAGKEIKIENNRIVFSDREVYENFLSGGNARSFIQSLPGGRDFVSFSQRKNRSTTANRSINGCEVPDDIVENNPDFFNMLSADGTVQIGDMIFRYDYCNDKIWVISATQDIQPTHHQLFMSGQETPGVVGQFPLYVDALDALAQGYSTMPADAGSASDNESFEQPADVSRGLTIGFTSDEWLYLKDDQKNPKSSETVRMDAKISYDMFAIYFHYYGKEKYQTRCVLNWCTTSEGRRDWYVNYSYTYRRKGSTTVHTGRGTLNPPVSGGENKVDKTFYSGSRGLRWGYNGWRWDVEKLFTNYRSLNRNGNRGGWRNIVTESYSNFTFRNNYSFNAGQFPFIGNF